MQRFLIAVVSAITLATPANAQETGGEGIEPYVRDHPLSEQGDYWFEISNPIIAGWQRTILVFGYADNASACDFLVKSGEVTAPGRVYRCVPAN